MSLRPPAVLLARASCSCDCPPQRAAALRSALLFGLPSPIALYAHVQVEQLAAFWLSEVSTFASSMLLHLRLLCCYTARNSARAMVPCLLLGLPGLFLLSSPAATAHSLWTVLA